MPAVAERMSKSETFAVKKGGTLVVDADNVQADIHIRTWDKNEVLVKVDGLTEDDMEDLQMKVTENTVYVEFFGGDWRRSRMVRFVINTPSEFNMDLATSGGDILVGDRLKGNVTAATSGGDIGVDDIDGSVELSTSGGDIAARSVSGDVEAATSGGDVDLGQVKGKIDVATSGGDIEVGGAGKSISAETAGGDVIVGDVGGDAEIATAGGDIQVGKVVGAAELGTAGGDIEAGGAMGGVTAQTAGGDIRLTAIAGFVQAETAGGDIEAELTPGGVKESTLETKGGDIILWVPAKAKATIDAEIRLHKGWDDEDYQDYDIVSEFKAESKDKDKRGIRAKYLLNGGGTRIRLETMHGSIEIRPLP
jgi:DUF4097 and DUF4098 domain-containing protein YvlB